VLDIAYKRILPIASRPINGSPSLELVGDADSVMLAIDMPRYAGRLADPVLSSAIREAGLKYHLAYALGSNLNRPPAERDQNLIKQQNEAGQQALDAVGKEVARLDEIERRFRP
jgi:hypothetical protein